MDTHALSQTTTRQRHSQLDVIYTLQTIPQLPRDILIRRRQLRRPRRRPEESLVPSRVRRSLRNRAQGQRPRDPRRPRRAVLDECRLGRRRPLVRVRVRRGGRRRGRRHLDHRGQPERGLVAALEGLGRARGVRVARACRGLRCVGQRARARLGAGEVLARAGLRVLGRAAARAGGRHCGARRESAGAPDRAGVAPRGGLARGLGGAGGVERRRERGRLAVPVVGRRGGCSALPGVARPPA